MAVLQPYLDKHQIVLLGTHWAADWQASDAMSQTENALTRNQDTQAIVAANDGTAGGCVQALEEKDLAGKVLVTGQDADLAACKRIVQRSQTMTVYKPIQPLAEAAAEAACQMVRGEVVTRAVQVVNNGSGDVPSILLDAVAVDQHNLRQTVVASGYHSEQEVFGQAAEAH